MVFTLPIKYHDIFDSFDIFKISTFIIITYFSNSFPSP